MDRTDYFFSDRILIMYRGYMQGFILNLPYTVSLLCLTCIKILNRT